MTEPDSVEKIKEAVLAEVVEQLRSEYTIDTEMDLLPRLKLAWQIARSRRLTYRIHPSPWSGPPDGIVDVNEVNNGT